MLCFTCFTDNDDFVIPSLSVEESDLGDWEASRVSDPQPPPKVLLLNSPFFWVPLRKQNIRVSSFLCCMNGGQPTSCKMIWHSCDCFSRNMLAYHRTANLHWLLHMVNDHCAFISIFAVPNFTSNVFFFATAHQGYREHISWTARCTAISWEEARGHFGYSRVPRQEQQSEGSWSEGIWKWPEQQRRKRWGLPPPQWRQPCQGPLQESRLTSCPVPSDTYLLLSSLAEWKPGDLSVYWKFFLPYLLSWSCRYVLSVRCSGTV